MNINVSRPRSRSQEIRESLGHPIIDGDGHTQDLLPVLMEFIAEVGGNRMVDRYREHPLYKFVVHQEALGTTLEQRRHDGRIFDCWWGYPSKTFDRATSMLPGLLEDRMGELGLDFAILFPSESGIVVSMDDEDMMLAGCRAHNMMTAQIFGPHSRYMTPTAVIPMKKPEQAAAEVEYAVGVLGLKTLNFGGSPRREIPGYAKRFPEASRHMTRPELFGIDSDYDYDILWAKCQEMKVAACFHAKELRQSFSSYVFNHIGAFTQGNEKICKALFMGGVTRRFPELNFGFLEGGVGWACSLYADLIGHWEKRNPEGLENTNPARLDRARMLALAEKYAKPEVLEAMRRGQGLDDNGNGTGGVEHLDDYWRCEITRKEDFKDLYVKRYYFGCEADDPINAWAFNKKALPMGARLNAFFSSDIGHFDVPDMTGVVPEAYELVEHGLLDDSDFRDFTFANAVRFWGEVNPDFFKGTVVEREAVEVLAQREAIRGQAGACPEAAASVVQPVKEENHGRIAS